VISQHRFDAAGEGAPIPRQRSADMLAMCPGLVG